MNRRFRASYRIAIGFVVLAGLAIYGPRYYNDLILGREHFTPLVPGEVNILGLDRREGYAILVENRAAKLVFAGQDSFTPGKMDINQLDASGGEKQFVPIKEMLAGLRGDIAGLSFFVEALNKLKDAEEYPNAPVWKVEDIKKAIDGDPTLQPKLEHDLNGKLDGTPLDTVSKRAVYEGILVDQPVTVWVNMRGHPVNMVARIKRDFRSNMMRLIESRLIDKFATDQMIANEYAVAANQVKTGELAKENLANSLQNFGRGMTDLGEFPQRIINSITTVVNENQITSASYKTIQTNKGTSYTLVISLTDEGRKRLWQFTRNRGGDQLLVTVGGVAIAAPFVDSGISSGVIEVTGLQDETLVDNAVKTINGKRADNSK